MNAENPKRRAYAPPTLASLPTPEHPAVLLECTGGQIPCPGIVPECCVDPSDSFCGDPGGSCNP